MALPEQERVPLELLYRAGLSQREIAEQLGLSVSTVKTLAPSALAHLARRLETRAPH
jgi:RNA polymerase sigma factor (sigma-70 family)